MRTGTLTALAALTLAPFVARAQGAAAVDFHWQGHLAAGKRLEIRGVNGSIRATGGGDQVDVSATKRARESDPASVEVKVVPFDGGVVICAVYPTPRRSEQPNECAPGKGYHSHTQNNDVIVDFAVRVPAGVEFSAQTVNGQVEASELGANVDASTVNGSIHVSTSGYAEATTVNGSIGANLGRSDWPDGLAFETVNGGITLTLPAALSTEVRAETVNGGITSEFPLTVQGRFGPKHVNGTIGNGGGRGRRLVLRTVNGEIRLKKAT